MKLYYINHSIDYPDHFYLYDELGIIQYEVKTKLSFGHIIQIYKDNQLILEAKDTITSYLPNFKLYENNQLFGSIKQKLSLKRIPLDMHIDSYYIQGDYLSNQYVLISNQKASIKPVIHGTNKIELSINHEREILIFITIESIKRLIT